MGPRRLVPAGRPLQAPPCRADPFLSTQRDLEDARRPKRQHPKGWEPGVDTAAGTITVQGDDTPPQDWSHILWNLGLDPKAWEVDEDASRYRSARGTTTRSACSTTGQSSGQRTGHDRVDVEQLIREIKRRKPPAPKEPLEERALVVCLADWQAGKPDHGGYEALIGRLLHLKAAVPARVRELAKAGRPVSQIVVAGMGDLVEGCDGHYAQQTFGVELDRRQQVKLVRRMLVEMLADWAKLPARMVVLGSARQPRREP